MEKRGRGRPRKNEPKKTIYYFDANEDSAIIDYITSDCQKHKNLLFEKTLKPAFTTMTESIIRKYFKNISQDEFDEYFNDTMSHVIDKMVKFSHDKGKGFSYIQQIIKNYLIGRVRERNKTMVRNISYEDISSDLDDDLNLSYNINSNHETELVEVIKETSNRINEMLENRNNKKMSENEIKIGFVLVELMNNWDTIFETLGSNKFNKSNVLQYIRETTNISHKGIMLAMKKFKKLYSETKKDIIY